MRQAGRRRGLHSFEMLEWRRLLTVINLSPQPIALQTPQIHALLKDPTSGQILTGFGNNFEIDALFDSASPGTVLSNEISDALGVQHEQAGGGDAVFTHDHSAGSIDFNIAQPEHMFLAPSNPFSDPELNDPATYNTDAGTQIMEIGPQPEDSNLADLNLIGLEAVAGNVVVLDPTPTNTFTDTFRTYVYPPGTPYSPDDIAINPGIPPVSNTVQLSSGDYTRFTTNVDGAASVPGEHTLMFVGPNPINPTLPDNTPPVSLSMGSNNTTGSFLFDTGSAESMISLAKAASLGVSYAPGTFDTSSAALVGVPASQQFRLTVQSLAGQVTLAGFYADSLTLQSDNGPIQINHAPLLVGDAAIGSASGPNVTLDGVLGMNLFSASAALDAQGKLINETPGAFNWITLDEANGTLGLDIAALAARPQVVASSFNFAGTQQSVTIQFTGETSGPVSSDFTLEDAEGNPTGIAVSSTYSTATHTATVTFPNLPHGMLPDGNYLLSLSSAGNVEDDDGVGLANDFTLAFWTFQGDANHDGTVNALDFNALASHFGQSNQGFANGDFNYDGVVNTTDFALLAGRFGKFFTGPDAPSQLLAPASAIAPPSGAAAPAPLPATLFSDTKVPKTSLIGLLSN